MNRNYRDLTLVLSEPDKGSQGHVEAFTVQVFDSPVGQGEQAERVVVPESLYGQLRRLENRSLDDKPEEQIKLGLTLGELLFPTYARGMLQRSMDRLDAEERLRIRLRFQEADELAFIPWEFVHLHEHRAEATSSGFLVLDSRISIVRHEVVATPGDWEHGPAQRRLVVAMASPRPQKQLKGLIGEQQAIRDAVSAVEGISADYYPVINSLEDLEQGATVKDLLTILEGDAPIDIFHFSGHGTFKGEKGEIPKTVKGEGGIILSDDNNRALLLPANRLAELLQGRHVRLVVLGACESAKRDIYHVWSSVAAALMQVGIPAVIAMQYRVNDSAAKAFMGTLYRSLAAGHTIDAAVSLGRQAMRLTALELGEKAQNRRDWGVPTLYLRSADGRVFTPVKDKAATKSAEAALEKLRVDVDQELGDVSGTAIGAAVGNMETGIVDVKTKVENIHKGGVVIGGAVYSMSGGRLSVKQNVNTVSGVLIGASIGRIGGPSSSSEADALQNLYEDLGIELLTVQDEQVAQNKQRFCQNCGEPVDPAANFCGSCGHRL